jgi:phage terminase large subunit
MKNNLAYDYNINLNPDIYNNHFHSYLDDHTPLQILFGGSSSGKSKFIAQRCIEDILRGGRNYLAIRKIADTCRASVYNELEKVIKEWEINNLFRINIAEMTFTCSNGFQIYCKGLDKAEKVKSITPKKGVITDIWVEEATEITKDDHKQLDKRLRGGSKKITKRMVLSFNPILKQHWLFKEFFGSFYDNDTIYRDNNLLIDKSTYKDNDFLTQQDIDKLENEEDEYWYEVYTLGNWGVLGDVIFKNWEVRDLTEEMKTFDNFKNGLDFGFAGDPMAFNRTHYDKMRKTIYITHEFNALGLTNPQIADLIRPVVNEDRVICDSAEPKSVQELRDNKINAEGAKKGKDSINFGIQWLQQQHIVIHKACQNTINEFQQYHWKKDKLGESLPIPVDKNNHHIDNIRYQYEDESFRVTPKIWTSIDFIEDEKKEEKKKLEHQDYIDAFNQGWERMR